MQRNWNVVWLEPFSQWLATLEHAAQKKIYAAIALLAQEGNQLSRPYADTLQGSKYANLKELRVPFSRSVFRICFVFDPKRNAVLLCGGDKQGANEKRFYKELIANAESIYEQYLQKLERSKNENHQL